MKILHTNLLLRLAVAIILLMHSIPGMFSNGVYDFGNLFLNEIGFAPMGVPLAWAIKISHVLAAFCILFDKQRKLACLITIFILVAGIWTVHGKEGWFVVGGGRNGIEFNFLLIVVLITIMFQDGLMKPANTKLPKSL